MLFKWNGEWSAINFILFCRGIVAILLISVINGHDGWLDWGMEMCVH